MSCYHFLSWLGHCLKSSTWDIEILSPSKPCLSCALRLGSAKWHCHQLCKGRLLQLQVTSPQLRRFVPFHQRRGGCGASSPNSRMHFSSCFGCKFEMCHAAVWIVSSDVSCKGRRSKPAGGFRWLPFRNAIETSIYYRSLQARLHKYGDIWY